MAKKLKKRKAAKEKPDKTARATKKEALGKKGPRRQEVAAEPKLVKALRKKVKNLEARMDELALQVSDMVKASAGAAETHWPADPGCHLGGTSGPPDDLQILRGIGPALATRLMNLGVLYFRQLAEMDDDQLLALDDRLLANGRVVRQDWRGQAKTMLKQASRNTV